MLTLFDKMRANRPRMNILARQRAAAAVQLERLKALHELAALSRELAIHPRLDVTEASRVRSEHDANTGLGGKL